MSYFNQALQTADAPEYSLFTCCDPFNDSELSMDLPDLELPIDMLPDISEDEEDEDDENYRDLAFDYIMDNHICLLCEFSDCGFHCLAHNPPTDFQLDVVPIDCDLMLRESMVYDEPLLGEFAPDEDVNLSFLSNFEFAEL
ncbi:hypothetical protein NQZ79_g4792 [Umbelopsis isabellina]|nr:hypothetical protein NQZ79_g4792 [Umbelopsis isabellina]